VVIAMDRKALYARIKELGHTKEWHEIVNTIESLPPGEADTAFLTMQAYKGYVQLGNNNKTKEWLDRTIALASDKANA
jgi:hypothetical protein